MTDFNRVQLMGRLGRDPEIRHTTTGAIVANVSIATTERWTDKQTNQKREETEWHNLVFWNRLAEIAGEYLRKGSLIFVVGKLKTEKWQDQSGQDRYTTKIQVTELKMIQTQQAQPQGQAYQATNQAYANARPANAPQGWDNGPGRQSPATGAQNQPGANPAPPPFDDDIPF